MAAGSIWRRVFAEPVTLVELFIVANLAFLAVDIYVAHSMNEFAHWAEWIPFVFSLTAPLLLVGAMFLAGGVRPPVPERGESLSTPARAGRALGMLVGAAAICVGVAGLVLHLDSQFFEQQTLQNLVYTAPFVAPLAYAGLGLLIVLNRMVRDNCDEWARWVVLLALGGWIGNFVLSLADHAQNAFFDWQEWIPVIASALAVGSLLTAVADDQNRPFLRFCIGLMIVEIVVSLAGWAFHLNAIAQSPMDSLWDRMVYSAPLFAPLLFANLALLAIIGLATLIIGAASRP
jgi:hypothetical protein